MTTILDILQHALGRDQYGRSPHPVGQPVNDRDYRNHYCAGGADVVLCREAVSQGLMVEHAAREISGGDPIFTVTDAGKAFVTTRSPKPPKLTPGQERYRRWLQVSDCYPDLKFGEWLKGAVR